AKQRSTHNSYVTFPVIFMMLTNTYPATYGHPLNWLILWLLIAIGVGVRHVMIARERGRPADWWLVPVSAALAGVVYLTSPAWLGGARHGGARVGFVAAKEVIDRRCVSCHSDKPSDDVLRIAPNAVTFETADSSRAPAETNRARGVAPRGDGGRGGGGCAGGAVGAATRSSRSGRQSGPCGSADERVVGRAVERGSGSARRRGIRALRPAQRFVSREVRLSVHHRRPPARQDVDPRRVRDTPREHRGRGIGDRARTGVRDRADSADRLDPGAMSPERSAGLTTHVLDTSLGRPAAGLRIDFSRVDADGQPRLIRTVTANAD